MRSGWTLPALGLATVLGAGPLHAEAATRTEIPSALADDPKAFWRAVMEAFYGPYDRALKCWVGTVDGQRQCMRPHRLDTVSDEAGTRFFIVTGGYPLGEGDTHSDCHACAGSLGLIVLEDGGDRLGLVARNSLAEPAGAWGAAPPEESFRLRQTGDGRHGWTMETGWSGQGYNLGTIVVFGIAGSDVIELGSIPVHADNSGICGDGFGDCYVRSYEVVFDPGAGGHHYDIVMRKTGEATEGPESFRVPFDDAALTYEVPAEAEALFNQ